MRPRILRILNRFNLGGPVRNAALLTRHLSPGFETLLAGGTRERGEADAAVMIREAGVEPVIIPEMRRAISPADDLAAFRRLLAIIDDFRPDIIHTHAAKAGAIGRMAALRRKVPVIVHTFHGHVFHSYFGRLKTAAFLHIERSLAKRSSALVAVSGSQKRDLADTYRVAASEKIRTIPVGLDLEPFRQGREEKRRAFRKKYKLGDEVIAIGIVGRLAEVKNHRLFLEALSLLKGKTSRRFRAFVVGDGELRPELFGHCCHLNLHFTPPGELITARSDVIFTSWITPADEVYPGLDIVALTSRNEGTPLSLMEAQAAGCPIVATSAGGVTDTVSPGETALLTPSGDASAFAESLRLLVDDDEKRAVMAAGGWEYVKDRFHYTRLIEETESLYRELLG